jgi:hypothetical protein
MKSGQGVEGGKGRVENEHSTMCKQCKVEGENGVFKRKVRMEGEREEDFKRASLPLLLSPTA